ncbi:ankyrin repeat-containing protein [Rutstroemia sp. NJR-2017a BVV2]|nr:ankyrin repeat-containing protein [Rutstroemia sp. NJR-2017a BVV2]
MHEYPRDVEFERQRPLVMFYDDLRTVFQTLTVDVQVLDDFHQKVIAWRRDLAEYFWGPYLDYAAKTGDIAKISELLKKGVRVPSVPIHRAEPESITYFHFSMAFYLAAKYGQKVALQLFLDNGADVNALDTDERSALHWAAEGGQLEIVHLLLAKGANINTVDKEKRSAVYWAVQGGNPKIVQLLQENGADVIAVDEGNRSALYWAVECGHLEIVQLLLDSNLNIAITHDDVRSALHWAAQEGRLEILRLLLDNCVDLAGIDQALQLELSEALKGGHLSLIELLLKQQAYFNLAYFNIVDALHWAVLNKSMAVAGFLIERVVNAGTDAKGRSLMHLAVMSEQMQIVKLVLEKANSSLTSVNCLDREFFTPLHYAARQGNLDIALFLLDNGAQVKFRSTSHETILHCAAQSGCVELVDILLNRGMDIEATTSSGKTALDIAVELEFRSLAYMLQQKKLARLLGL